MSKDKAREFWIDADLGQVLRCKPFASDYVRFTHVIEYSAYDALEAKLAECVDVLERLAKYESAQRGQAGLQSMIVDAREVLARVKK